MKIALISCAKENEDRSCVASELCFAKELFVTSYKFAKSWADKIFILSTAHYLAPENMIIEPSGKTLKKFSRKEQRCWAEAVIDALSKECDIESDEFMILAERIYYRDLIQDLVHCYLPLENLNVRKSILWLNKASTCRNINAIIAPFKTNQVNLNVAKACLELHELCNYKKPRYCWKDISNIPCDNGVYVIFEKGETYHGMCRITRVGTHIAAKNLKRRLRNHFTQNSFRKSIFRKNIGKAILTKNNLPITYSSLKNIQPCVSDYLRNNCRFTVFCIEDLIKRLQLEKAIISTLNQTCNFGPSKTWLGHYSPKVKIRNSGMWVTQGLNSNTLTKNQMDILKSSKPLIP